METVFQLWSDLLNFFQLDGTMLWLYVAAGFIAKAYFDHRWNIPFTKREITMAWKTLFIGTAVCIAYMLIEFQGYENIGQTDQRKLFYTYIFATGTYQLFLKDTVAAVIVGWLKKIKSIIPQESEEPKQ